MKYLQIVVAAMLILALPSHAQELGKLKMTDYSYGVGKFKKAKRVYIAYFNVNFELYKEAVDYKQGGKGFGSSRSSDATARAAIGLSGVDSADIQATTNRLYEEFVAEMKSYGLEIVSTEEAKATKVMKKWEMAKGPYVIESEIPGVMVSVPDNFSFLYNGSNITDKSPKLSKQLDDAIVVGVNLYAMFSQDKANLFKGKAAKVKLLTNYRLVGKYAASVPKTKGLRLKGSSTVHRVSSGVNFTWSKMRIGAGALAQYSGTLKKPLEIGGVMKKEKVVAYQKQGSSTPTSFSSYSHMDLANRFSTTAKWIDVDSKAYSQGLYSAGDAFIKGHIAKAFKKLKKK